MYIEKTTSYAHQLTARNLQRGRDGFGLLMEMGTGKTKVDIDATGELFEETDIQQWLILAPKGVYSNWTEREIPTHMPDHLRERTRIGLWDGGHTIASREGLMGLFDNSYSSILAMNIEAMGSTDRAFEFAVAYCKNRPTKVTIDESTRIKTPEAKATKGAMALRDRAAQRRILSGLPNPNGPMDLYSQFDFLKSQALGTNFFSFRHKYAILRDQQVGWYKNAAGVMKPKMTKLVVGYQRQDELAQRIAKMSYRVKKEDCLDLPPENFRIRDIEMTNEQWRIYRDLLNNCTAELDSAQFVTTTLVITQLLRLHQVVCGHVKDDNGVVHPIKNNRVTGLMEEIEELGDRPAIIWCNYSHNIMEVTEALNRYRPGRTVQYHGGMSRQECDIALDKFQKYGDADWFVGNQQKGGIGITLVRAAHDFFYSNNYNLELRLQTEARTHRSGQHWPVTHTDLRSRGTVDEAQVRALRKKIDLATTVLQDGYKQWLI